MNPLLSISVSPKSDADRRRLDRAVRVLMREDPWIGVSLDEANGSVILGSMGEQHLEIVIDRLLREFGVEANLGRPRVNYLETVTKTAEGASKYVSRGEYAHVKLRLSPLDAGSGVIIENEVVTGAIPERFFAAVEEGVRRAARRGVLKGYPVVGVRIQIYDGSYHDTDSTPEAFTTSAVIAFDDAASKSAPVLLEPIMQLVVETPREYAADVASSLGLRGGRIHIRRDVANGRHTIGAAVPLANLFGYAIDLRSATGGRATFEMQLDSYRPAATEDDSGDRGAFVGEPRSPRTPPRRGSIALPEPDDDSVDR